MRTRGRLLAQEKPQEKKSVTLKLRVHKLINPMHFCQMFNSMFISENLLEAYSVRFSPLESFFSYNKIVSGHQEGNYIRFTTVPINNYQDFYDDYIYNRFLSLGNDSFKQLAETFMDFKQLKKTIKKRQIVFPSLQDVTAKLNHEIPTIIIVNPDKAIHEGALQPMEVLVSEAFVRMNGWDDTGEFIVRSMKIGKMDTSFKVVVSDPDTYISNTLDLMNSHIGNIRSLMPQQPALMAETCDSMESSETKLEPLNTLRGEAKQYSHWQQNRDQMTNYNVFAASPHIEAYQMMATGVMQRSNSKVPMIPLQKFTEEDEMLQLLLTLPQNHLKKHQDKVCGFKNIVPLHSNSQSQ